MREADLMRAMQLEATKLGARLWRNNIGNGWMGDAQELPDGTVLLRRPRRVAFGIPGIGGSDLMGWRPRNGIAQVVCLETKTTTGKTSTAQEAWLACVSSAGGCAGVCRNLEDVRRLLG